MNSALALVVLMGLIAPSLSAWAQAPVPANIVLSQDGRNVLDTPEVAQARAAHLNALSQARTQGGNDNDDGSYDPRWENEAQYQSNENQWNAPAQPNQWNAPAQPNQWNAPAQVNQWNAPAQPNQWNAPAPVNEWNAPAAQPNQWNAAPNNWKNQPANIALSADGKFVLDTPEVAKARAAHLAAYSALNVAPQPQQAWSGAPAQQWSGAPAQQWSGVSQQPQQWSGVPQQAQPQQWNGAPSWQSNQKWAAAPVALSQDGRSLQDTPEVAQARAAHLAAHAQAQSQAAPARQW